MRALVKEGGGFPLDTFDPLVPARDNGLPCFTRQAATCIRISGASVRIRTVCGGELWGTLLTLHTLCPHQDCNFTGWDLEVRLATQVATLTQRAAAAGPWLVMCSLGADVRNFTECSVDGLVTNYNYEFRARDRARMCASVR